MVAAAMRQSFGSLDPQPNGADSRGMAEADNAAPDARPLKKPPAGSRRRHRVPLHARPVWVKGLLLLLMIYPFAYGAWFLSVLSAAWESDRLPIPGGLLFGLHLTAMAAILAVVITFAVDVRRQDRIDAGHRTFWQSFTLFGNPVSLFVYWWNFVRRGPDETSGAAPRTPADISAPMRWLLGLASLLPLAFSITIVVWVMTAPPGLFPPPGPFFWIWAAAGLLLLGVELYYVRDIYQRPELEGRRGRWVLGVLAYAPFLMPVYWWKFIHPPDRPTDAA